MAVVAMAACPIAFAAKKTPPPEKDEPIQTATETWYLGVIESVDTKAGTLTIFVKGSGQTIQQRRGKEISNISVSSAAAKPGLEEHKKFQLARDCQVTWTGRPKASLLDFRVGDPVKVAYQNQAGLLVAVRIAYEQPSSGRKPVKP